LEPLLSLISRSFLFPRATTFFPSFDNIKKSLLSSKKPFTGDSQSW
jgi:hypothetical protein